MRTHDTTHKPLPLKRKEKMHSKVNGTEKEKKTETKKTTTQKKIHDVMRKSHFSCQIRCKVIRDAWLHHCHMLRLLYGSDLVVLVNLFSIPFFTAVLLVDFHLPHTDTLSPFFLPFA